LLCSTDCLGPGTAVLHATLPGRLAFRTARIEVLLDGIKAKPLGVMVTLDDAKLLLAIVDLTLEQFDAAAESLAEKLVKAAPEKNNPRKQHKK
jgi:predicted FMN-binding regulatory protein PaiB